MIEGGERRTKKKAREEGEEKRREGLEGEER